MNQRKPKTTSGSKRLFSLWTRIHDYYYYIRYPEKCVIFSRPWLVQTQHFRATHSIRSQPSQRRCRSEESSLRKVDDAISFSVHLADAQPKWTILQLLFCCTYWGTFTPHTNRARASVVPMKTVFVKPKHRFWTCSRQSISFCNMGSTKKPRILILDVS